jgi:hypothetical protein
MDTTSHNFTWQTYTFGGQGGSSALYDVAIINGNDIWAVGEIYTADDKYNAVHWDGSSWELKKIMFYIDPDQPIAGKISSSCESIFVFGDNDFIVSSNVQIARFSNDNEYDLIYEDFEWIERFTMNSIWGISSTDFYVVGNGGNIARFYGSSWLKIESGTSADIKDIYGINKSVSGNKILAVASSTGNTRILTINPNMAMDTLDWPINNILVGIWLNDKSTYVSGLGIWKNKDNRWEEVTGTERFYTRVKGSGSNNIFGVGSSSDGIIHYNGSSWKVIEEVPAGWGFFSLDVKEDIVVAVGASSSGSVIGDAVVFMGKQIQKKIQ